MLDSQERTRLNRSFIAARREPAQRPDAWKTATKKIGNGFTQIERTAVKISSCHPAFAAVPGDRRVLDLVVTLVVLLRALLLFMASQASGQPGHRAAIDGGWPAALAR